MESRAPALGVAVMGRKKGEEGRGGGSRQSIIWFRDDTMNMGTALTASSRNCSMEGCVMRGNTGKRRVSPVKK
jgi:hypothetical protein